MAVSTTVQPSGVAPLAAGQTLPSWRVVLVGAWVSLTAAVVIGLREVDALIGQVLVGARRCHSRA